MQVEVASSFDNLGLPEELVRAVKNEGYTIPPRSKPSASR